MDIGKIASNVLSSPLTETIGSLLIGGNRSIMGMFADVVVKESHNDEIVMTEHPTEYGSPISDHYYKLPEEVTMEIGWSESAGKLNKMLGNSFIGMDLSLRGIYQGLLAMQGKRLIVSTGKRLYTNMLIKSIKCETEMPSENALMITIVFKKNIVAKVRETEVMLEDQANPSETSGVQNEGTKQAQPASSSILKTIFGG